MAKKALSDFTIECHLDGWHCKGKSKLTRMVGGNVKILRKGQKFSGDEIMERMVSALEPPEDTFKDKKNQNKVTKVLTLIGGNVKELRAAYDDRKQELLAVDEDEVVTPEPTPDPEPEKEKPKEPKRTPRPPQ